MTQTQQPLRASGASTAFHHAAPRLAAVDLACRRGTRLLFKGLTLAVEPGQIVWLRGQNGRGKTSLLRLAAGLSTPEHGQILIDGTPARHAASGRHMLFLAHANALKDDLSTSEALAFLLRLHGGPSDLATVHAALERVGLHSRRDAMVRTLSQGQRRRVALARLAAERCASLWLLDEPYDSLDADGVERVNDLLAAHVRRRGSVLLTSHVKLATSLLHPIEIDLDAYA
jgi:heme exporter protein A